MKILPFLALALIAAAPSPISPSRIKADVRTLASDEFMGRGPGEPGEAKTIEFLVALVQGGRAGARGDRRRVDPGRAPGAPRPPARRAPCR